MASGKYGNSRAIDVSDWGRPIARFFANRLKNTPVSVIMVTNFHLLASIFCAWLILNFFFFPFIGPIISYSLWEAWKVYCNFRAEKIG